MTPYSACLPWKTNPETRRVTLSSHAKSHELRRGQQTIHEAVNSHRIHEPIRGIHPRVELPSEEFEAWLEGNRDVEYVVINFTDAEAVVERDGDLREVLEPWHIPILLGTEYDELVSKRTFQDVLDLLGVTQPAIYVPDVVYNYRWMDEATQEKAIEAYVNYVTALQKRIIEEGLDIRLIPTNKGWRYEHFVKYRDLFDRFGYDEFAFYAVQYTGGDAGNASTLLRGHIRNVISALALRDVFVVGRLSSDDLLRFAPRVRGATGLRQWKRACSTEDGLSQERWPEWRDVREAKLSLNNGQMQTRVTEFSGSTEGSNQ